MCATRARREIQLAFITRIRKLIHSVSSKLTEDGSSLLESMMALSILSIGMLGTGSLALGIVRSNVVSKNLTAATTLAQEKMEDIKAMGYSGLPAASAEEIEDYGTISYEASSGATHYSETDPWPEGLPEAPGATSTPGIAADYSGFKRMTSTQIDTPVAGMKTVTIRAYSLTSQHPITLKRIFAE